MRTHVSEAIESRSRLVTALRDSDSTTGIPGQLRFVPLRDAPRVATRMRELGVAVRPFAELPLVSAGLRTSGGAALRISSAWLPSDCARRLAVALRGEGDAASDDLHYGAGNLHSLAKALAGQASISVSNGPGRAVETDVLVLPGVGSFPQAAQRLDREARDARCNAEWRPADARRLPRHAEAF